MPTMYIQSYDHLLYFIHKTFANQATLTGNAALIYLLPSLTHLLLTGKSSMIVVALHFFRARRSVICRSRRPLYLGRRLHCQAHGVKISAVCSRSCFQTKQWLDTACSVSLLQSVVEFWRRVFAWACEWIAS